MAQRLLALHKGMLPKRAFVFVTGGLCYLRFNMIASNSIRPPSPMAETHQGYLIYLPPSRLKPLSAWFQVLRKTCCSREGRLIPPTIPDSMTKRLA